MKILKAISPYLYLLMVVFVVFHNTGYQLRSMMRVPYILYVLLAVVSAIVIQMVIKESKTTD